MKTLEIKDLVKVYPNSFKLGSIDLEIESGTIVGLIGENGAGKTTLIKSILNILKIDNGNIKIFNKDYQKYEQDIKEDIGVVLDIYKNWDSELFNKYLEEFSLPKNKIIKDLSKGMKKKVEIITALSHHPKLLILDEPTSGLDPVIRSEVLDLFLKFIQDENNSILFSTHITTDLEHIADKIVFIDNGKVILDKTRDEIIDNYGILKCDSNYFKEISKEDIISYRKNKYDYEVLIKDKDKLRKKYKDVIIDKITLEDLMVLMIKGEKVC